ncbi:hypothetical protein RRG08_062441 [Elysia crispata]|uniref:Uncharacterized protein n=1 Tax=Elysia crispata TaxID=231223 RepID=A0AAE0XNJ4_9GAST|nr:hypothetical protein RRG08_062441 [Elysia crispata]
MTLLQSVISLNTVRCHKVPFLNFAHSPRHPRLMVCVSCEPSRECVATNFRMTRHPQEPGYFRLPLCGPLIWWDGIFIGVYGPDGLVLVLRAVCLFLQPAVCL